MKLLLLGLALTLLPFAVAIVAALGPGRRFFAKGEAVALDEADFTNWTVPAGCEAVEGLYPEMGAYVDTGGVLPGDAALLETKKTFTFFAGKTYRLQFVISSAAGPGRSTIARIGPLSETFTAPDEGFEFTTWVFTPEETFEGSISFETPLAGQKYPQLDDVRLIKT